MARITVEDCLKKVDNKFILVNLAAKRVRQIREGWVQALVLDVKGAAFLLLAPALALRAFAGNVGLSREDAGEVLRDVFVAGVLVATIDGWALLAVQLANALSAGLGGGDPVLPGAADAGRMAQQASLPLSFAPFPEDVAAARARYKRNK